MLFIGSGRAAQNVSQGHQKTSFHKNTLIFIFFHFFFQVEVSGPRREEDFAAGGVAEAPQGGEEAEEAGVVAEEDLEEGRKCWLNHTDMKVIISLSLFFFYYSLYS